MNFLACDLGGTKVLLGIFERVINDDSPKLLLKKKYISSDWDSFELILEDFLKNECKNITHPSSAYFIDFKFIESLYINISLILDYLEVELSLAILASSM